MTYMHVFPDHPSFVDGSAAFIADMAAGAIAERGRFTFLPGKSMNAVGTRCATQVCMSIFLPGIPCPDTMAANGLNLYSKMKKLGIKRSRAAS
jgi:hypothetical protein